MDIINDNSATVFSKKKVLAILALTQILDENEDDNYIKVALENGAPSGVAKEPRSSMKNIENVAMVYSIDDFRSRYRFERDTFQYLLDILGPSLIEKRVKGAGPHTNSSTTQLLVALNMLVNREIYRTSAEQFDISKSTAWSYVTKVCTILSGLAEKYICWPTGRKAQLTIEHFKKKQGFPGVLGAIGGTHIRIAAPSKDRNVYRNRHHYYSITLQGVCNADYMFTDVFAGYPGSVLNVQVFINSPLGQKMHTTPLELFPEESTHVLGDLAYNCTNFLLTPFSDNDYLTKKQRQFNHKQSSTRLLITQCFGMLKSRFHILKHVNVYNKVLIPKIIIACCVLHNICMNRKDNIEDYETEDEHCIPDEELNNADSEGIAKRNFICDKIYR